MRRRMLVVSTVSQSLALQSPTAWDVAREQGFDVTFAAARDEWTPTLLSQDASFLELPNARGLRPAGVAELARELKRVLAQSWDAIIIQTPIIAALVRLQLPRSARDRCIYVVHGFHFYDGAPAQFLPFRAVEFLLASRTHMAVVNSWDADWASSLPVRRGPLSMTRLPGAGVDVSRFERADAMPDAPVPYVLFVGELNSNKNPVFVIDIVREARLDDPTLSAVIIGDGPLRPEIQALADANDWVHYIPRSNTVDSWLRSAEALLAPSAREGLPRVVIEALASGKPVLSRANRGSSELLRNHPEWLLPATATAADWARRLTEVRRSRPDPETLTDEARQYDTAAFDDAFATMLRSHLPSEPEGTR
ncbi:glycosyltransferase [Calidifontibacter indicus]|uniref:glycosyltransferase n=1 Tax=Calidifontibacter indicus TaxID=419650 RepID=UPI003D765823